MAPIPSGPRILQLLPGTPLNLRLFRAFGVALDGPGAVAILVLHGASQYAALEAVEDLEDELQPSVLLPTAGEFDDIRQDLARCGVGCENLAARPHPGL